MHDSMPNFAPLQRAIYRYARFGETTTADEFEAAVHNTDVVIARMDYRG
jgi:hypothetical protein